MSNSKYVIKISGAHTSSTKLVGAAKLYKELIKYFRMWEHVTLEMAKFKHGIVIYLQYLNNNHIRNTM